MDWLIQRYLPGTANEAHRDSGSWEDVIVIRDLTADQARDAARDALTALAPVIPNQPDRVRAIKWDAIYEFDAALGQRVLADRVKQPPAPLP